MIARCVDKNRSHLRSGPSHRAFQNLEKNSYHSWRNRVVDTFFLSLSTASLNLATQRLARRLWIFFWKYIENISKIFIFVFDFALWNFIFSKKVAIYFDLEKSTNKLSKFLKSQFLLTTTPAELDIAYTKIWK